MKVSKAISRGKYKIVAGSESGHCCFECTVIDTDTGENLAECMDWEDAERIKKALTFDVPV